MSTQLKKLVAFLAEHPSVRGGIAGVIGAGAGHKYEQNRIAVSAQKPGDPPPKPVPMGRGAIPYYFIAVVRYGAKMSTNDHANSVTSGLIGDGLAARFFASAAGSVSEAAVTSIPTAMQTQDILKTAPDAKGLGISSFRQIATRCLEALRVATRSAISEFPFFVTRVGLFNSVHLFGSQALIMNANRIPFYDPTNNEFHRAATIGVTTYGGVRLGMVFETGRIQYSKYPQLGLRWALQQARAIQRSSQGAPIRKYTTLAVGSQLAVALWINSKLAPQS